MKKWLLLPLTLALTSCASHLTKEQCETMNWKSEGYQDATAGKLPRDLSGAIADCAKFNLSVNSKQYMSGYQSGASEYCQPNYQVGYVDGQAGKSIDAINYRLPVCNRAGINLNLSQYKSGRASGLKQFCTYQNGNNIAREGKALPNVCPPALEKSFKKGWLAGQHDYCDQPANAFALGKAGSAYPATCPANLFVGFKSEYDRGAAIGNQIRAGEARISEINSYVQSKRFQFDFIESADGFYRLGRDQSPEANSVLAEINNMIRERKRIERDVFDLKVRN